MWDQGSMVVLGVLTPWKHVRHFHAWACLDFSGEVLAFSVFPNVSTNLRKVNDSGFPTPRHFFLPVQILRVSEIKSHCSWTFPNCAGSQVLPWQNVHKRHHNGTEYLHRESLDVLEAWGGMQCGWRGGEASWGIDVGAGVCGKDGREWGREWEWRVSAFYIH